VPIACSSPSPSAAPITPTPSTIRLARVDRRTNSSSPQLGEPLLAAAYQDESLQVAAVRLENRRLEAFDPALLLLAPVVSERLVEDLEALGLKPANRRAPPDEQSQRPPCTLLS
jgi:hypothetical protein